MLGIYPGSAIRKILSKKLEHRKSDQYESANKNICNGTYKPAHSSRCSLLVLSKFRTAGCRHSSIISCCVDKSVFATIFVTGVGRVGLALKSGNGHALVCVTKACHPARTNTPVLPPLIDTPPLNSDASASSLATSGRILLRRYWSSGVQLASG